MRHQGTKSCGRAIPELQSLCTGLSLRDWTSGGASRRQAADSLWLATRAAVPDAAVWAPTVLNVIRAANFLLLAVAVAVSSKPPGQAAVQLIGTLLFAGLGIIGLRRACAIVDP